ncbi:MAG: response regulator [Campylobacteraceae bacterium]|nr:response regulator [Campylobacteraceae bacterium]
MDIKEVKQTTQTLNILYVEDDLETIEHVASILKSLFLSVDVSHDGKEGLDKYKNYYDQQKKYYDVILTDIEMPNINGIELCERILEINPEQYIIVISAYNDKEKLQQLLSLGVNDFLHKPVNSENFFKTFRKCGEFVSHQNKIREELYFTQEANQNLETLLDIVNQVAIISKSDLEGNITFVNDLFCEISKYTKEELIGQKHNIIKHKDMPSEIYKHIWEDIIQGKVWRGKLKNRAKDGEPYYANANIFPIFDHQSNVSQYIAILFLTTEEEVKNREFKKKVITQYQESKRNDFKSRKMIDDLQKQLKNCKNYDAVAFALQIEKDDHLKCQNQLMITLQNYTLLEKKYRHYKSEVKDRISNIVDQNKKISLDDEETFMDIVEEEDRKRNIDANQYSHVVEIKKLNEKIKTLEHQVQVLKSD